jgi:hypothetical protein
MLLDNVIVVDGKIDATGSEPKVLVDKIWVDLNKVPPRKNKKKKKAADKKPVEKSLGASAEMESAPQISEDPKPYDADGDTPPPPDSFPESWVDEKEPNGKSKPEPEAIEANGAEKANGNNTSEESAAVIHNSAPISSEDVAQPKQGDTAAVLPASRDEKAQKFPKPIVPPKPPISNTSLPIKMVTVHIDGSGDHARDILRIRRIYGMLISYPGNDRFTFQVTERQRSHMLEFPNDTTGINEELQSRLFDLLGSEKVRVEEITY